LDKDKVAAKANGTADDSLDDNVKSGDVGIQNLKPAEQPDLVTGGIMRKYQLEGLDWLRSLYFNGLNGILADEMGLGKTIQTISLLAFLHSVESYGPFLVVAPLSTTSNWKIEFNKWTPDIKVLIYHGTPDTRAEIRKTKFKGPGTPSFPVVITSYEMLMNDAAYLSKIPWSYVIVDEGHRIKNKNSKLVMKLEMLSSANRLLITGTPLQNNLSELWSLLHFLMPTIFTEYESFESWFDFSALKDKKGIDKIFSQEQQDGLISSLHAILKPFLLRRIKTDVEKKLPKKREYVLYAPLSPLQKDLYQAILSGTDESRAFLEEKVIESVTNSGAGTPMSIRSRSVGGKRKTLDVNDFETPNKSARTSRNSTPATSINGSRTRARRGNYAEISDREFFSNINQPARTDTDPSEDEDDQTKFRTTTLAFAKKLIATKKLSNPTMQLRLCCNHPYNFYNPFLLPDGTINPPDETLVTASGKMLLLDTLLRNLFKEKHKVLIFSQFTTTLDLLDQYAEMRGWQACRIDGTTPQEERASQILAFNDLEGSTNLFLLSTRSGGVGINLTAADTVVLFDSDWNPQQDLQAQDRAHRIGQTRNVIVYRFATRNTVEQKLLDDAESKRRLEKLVIQKGGVSASKKAQANDIEDLRNLLRRADGEAFDLQGALLSDKDLKILTDRSDEAYERAKEGLDKGDAFKTIEAIDGGLLETFKS
jgi:ATP-dependent DNA helicase